MSTTGPRPTATDSPKATLHCPHCAHESRYDDDWLVVETARRVRLLCPECGTTIATRPREGEPSVPLTPSEAWEAAWKQWGDGLKLYRELWRPSPPAR